MYIPGKWIGLEVISELQLFGRNSRNIGQIDFIFGFYTLSVLGNNICMADGRVTKNSHILEGKIETCQV